MRDRTSWRASLMAQLRPVWDAEKQGMELGTFLDVELGIALIVRVCPHETVTAGYELLTGYPLLRALGVEPDHGGRDAIAVARHLLGPLRTRRDWETAVGAYRKVAEDLRAFTICADDRASAREVSVAPDRFDTYARSLATPPKFVRRAVKPAPEGDYTLTAHAQTVSVRVPQRLTGFVAPEAHDLTARDDRTDRTFTWRELAATAVEVDRLEAARKLPDRGDWARRFARLDLRVRGRDGFDDAQELTIAGVLHLIGMVGAGKSTLMMLLAVCAARRNLRVTLVLGDVLASARAATWLRAVGVSAAPVIGAANQQRHINRLHQVHAAADRDGSALLGFERANDLLSTACGLDALRPNATPWDFRDAPCRDRLARPKENGRVERYGCPLWSTCQRHASARDCVRADVLVATPASLVHSRVPQELNPDQLRYLELVWRRSDLIIIDEADQVQAQLDAMFSPGQTLIGHDDEAWLELLMDHTERELRGRGRAQFDERLVREWSTRVNTARTTANRLYALLRRNPLSRGRSTMVRWIGRDCFTEWTLADKLVRQWSGVGNSDRAQEPNPEIRGALDQFLIDPLGRRGRAESELAVELVELTRALVNLADEDECSRLVTGWLQRRDFPQEFSTEQTRELALRLEFTALLAVLSNTLNSLIRGWRAVEAPLNFDAASGLMFQRPPEDYTPIVPAPPMGNVLGYQYREEAGQPGRMGQLRFFRCAGVGRWIMLNLHRLFEPDSASGPRVLLMSGTSWAGTSPRYDIQIPVGAILRAPPEELTAVDETRFFLEPVYDEHGNAVAVSGQRGERRRHALRAILRSLATQRRPGDPSRFEAELDVLPAQRRRILLVVGSYAEARQVAEDLVEIRGDWRGRVRHLVADDAEFAAYWTPTLRRGEVSRLAATDALFLVAPLMAIERGHNILNPDGQAALGSAYFLVRPHPRPDDISYPVQSMNRWAVDRIRELDERRTELPTTDLRTLARALRAAGYRRWQRMLTAPLVYGSLDPRHDRPALAWTQLVTIWQVIGRLVRGGSAARVHFCDAKFIPDPADPESSLLVGMHRVLDRYLGPDRLCRPADGELAESLYGPLHRALARIPGVTRA